MTAVLLSGVGAAIVLPGFNHDRKDLITHTVQHETIALTIVERGTLESANNHDIICRVNVGNKPVATTIKWVIDDGSLVKAGQQVMHLDDSALRDQLRSQKIILERAENERDQAREELEIIRSQNASDLATAEVTLELALLEKETYEMGEYEQERKDIEARKLLAESDLEMWLDRVAWSERMVRKNFLSETQAQADRARLRSARVALDKVEEELRVLINYNRKRRLTELNSAIAEARRALDRIQIEARSKENQARKDYATKQSIYLQEFTTCKEIQEEIRKCIITAPADGMVVYYIPPQSRYGSSSRQVTIAQGEPVSDGQKLLQIPDLNNMVVNTRVHEALVSHITGEVHTHTHFVEELQAALMTTPALDTRLLSLPSLLSMRDSDDRRFAWLREKDAIKTYNGERATIRADSYPNRPLQGHVKTVAAVASQDHYSSDVKVYTTMVAIHNTFPGLRPGMSAVVTIHTDKKVENVLAVPVQAVVRVAGKSGRFKCYVKTPTGVEERFIELGLSNERMIEVKSGLDEGDEVVLNPKAVGTDADQSFAPGRTQDRSRSEKRTENGDKNQGTAPAEGDNKRQPAP